MASLRHLLCIGLMCYLLLEHCHAMFPELDVSFCKVSHSHPRTVTKKGLIYITPTKADVSVTVRTVVECMNVFGILCSTFFTISTLDFLVDICHSTCRVKAKQGN